METKDVKLPPMDGSLNGSSMERMAETASRAKAMLGALNEPLLDLHPHARDFLSRPTDYQLARLEWERMAKSLDHVRRYLECLQSTIVDNIHR